MSDDKSDRKGCLYFGLGIFAFVAIKPLFGLIIGASTEEIYSSGSYDYDTGEFTKDVDLLRTGFVILIITLIVYFYPHFKKRK